MFTGIVEAVGRIERIRDEGALRRLEVVAPSICEGVAIGDSIAIDGACLTVTENRGDGFSFDAIAETLARTSLGALEVGSRVNLERAMRADARFDGHIVQGHVDETGKIERLERTGEDVRLHVGCSPAFSELFVEKGSVAIAGVSLTVVGVRDRSFDVALIPHTLEVTTLGQLEPGAAVNLEGDVLGKYVKRYLKRLAVST